MAKKISRYAKLREFKVAGKTGSAAEAEAEAETLAGEGTSDSRTGRGGATLSANREVAISDDMIRLGQFLKLADLAEDGIEAREFIEQGLVSVNGVSASQRGKQLHAGDVVSAHGDSVRIVHLDSQDEEVEDFEGPIA